MVVHVVQAVVADPVAEVDPVVEAVTTQVPGSSTVLATFPHSAINASDATVEGVTVV